MASANWIESAYTLSKLPTPLDAESGRIQASTVTSISESRKRKRQETAVAIDGEGINVYSVETSQTEASYAVAPDTYFDCSPCSLYLRRNKQAQHRRLTYAAIRSSKPSKIVRLHCYEDASQDATSSVSRSSGSALPSSAPVKLIDTLSLPQITQSNTQSLQVLALQQDGTVSCYSEKIGECLWSVELSSLPAAADGFDLPEDFQIDHAEVTTLGVARHGFLKARQDALSTVDSNDDSILVIIGSSPSLPSSDVLDSDIHVYSLPRRHSKNSSSSRTFPRQLLSWSLPQGSDRERAAVSEYAFSPSTSFLTELGGGLVKTYDLTTLTPTLVDSFVSKVQHDAVLRISSFLLLSASPSAYAVYDSKYGSLLASHTLPPSEGTPRKRKTMVSEPLRPRTTFVDYFLKSGTAVALRDGNLVAIQLGAEARKLKRQKLGTLLIDSLGKGSLAPPTAGSAVEKHSKLSSKRKRKQQTQGFYLFASPELDDLIAKEDVEGFDRQFAAAVHIDVNDNELNGTEILFPGEEASSRTRWAFPRIDKLHSYPPCRPQALYALSRIFEPDYSTEQSAQFNSNPNASFIRLKFYPENVFMWLVHTGQLRADLIQRALAELLGADQHVSPGDVVKSLAEFDPSLALIHYMLRHQPRLDVDELVTAVKVTVNSLDDSALPQPEQKVLLDEEFANAATTAGALTSGVNGLTNGDAPITNGHSEHDQEPAEADEEADAVMDDIDDMMDHAYETLDKGLPIRGDSLRQALTKLNSLPLSIVTRRLRTLLTHHELIFLIHILRVELENGGWTSRYENSVDSDGPENHEEPSNRAITVISNMLSCAVDALGMSGWLMASASNPFDSIDETLNLLRTEISATLEGVHEATFTHGVLSDFLRHHYKRQKSSLKDREVEPEERWRQGKTVVVRKGPPAHLPVGLTVEKTIEAVRTTMYGGAKVKRPGEIGKEIRRGLPQYVFERIRF